MKMHFVWKKISNKILYNSKWLNNLFDLYLPGQELLPLMWTPGTFVSSNTLSSPGNCPGNCPSQMLYPLCQLSFSKLTILLFFNTQILNHKLSKKNPFSMVLCRYLFNFIVIIQMLLIHCRENFRMEYKAISRL